MQDPVQPWHGGTVSAGPCGLMLFSVRIYFISGLMTLSVLPAVLLKHTAAAQVNYRPAAGTTGCNRLACVERLTDPGTAEPAPEPEKL